MPRSLLLRWLMRAAQIDRAHLNVTNDKTLGFNIKTNANFLPRSSVTVPRLGARRSPPLFFFCTRSQHQFPSSARLRAALI
jgi:hypothetical protein